MENTYDNSIENNMMIGNLVPSYGSRLSQKFFQEIKNWMIELLDSSSSTYMIVPPRVLDSIYEMCYALDSASKETVDIGHIVKEYRKYWNKYWGDFA